MTDLTFSSTMYNGTYARPLITYHSIPVTVTTIITITSLDRLTSAREFAYQNPYFNTIYQDSTLTSKWHATESGPSN